MRLRRRQLFGLGDGYAAYKIVAANSPDGRIVLAFCSAHLRRRFFDQAKGVAPIAREAPHDHGRPEFAAFRPWLEQRRRRVDNVVEIEHGDQQRHAEIGIALADGLARQRKLAWPD